MLTKHQEPMHNVVLSKMTVQKQPELRLQRRSDTDAAQAVKRKMDKEKDIKIFQRNYLNLGKLVELSHQLGGAEKSLGKNL